MNKPKSEDYRYETASFTPGPWGYTKEEHFMYGKYGGVVCVVRGVTPEVKSANARLIVIAPEMLQKLKDVVQSRGILLESEVFEIIDLIKKAEPEYETSFPFTQ